MSMKYTVFFIMALTIGSAGCGGSHVQIALPAPRPLGDEYGGFRPSDRPAETADELARIEPVDVITLHHSLARALMHNPRLRSYSWNVRAAEADWLQAGRWPNPEVKVEFDGVGGSGERKNFDGAEIYFGLSQLIELGGKRNKRIELAAIEGQASGWSYETIRLAVFADVVNAYVGVLAAQQRLELIGELVRLSEELMRSVARRVDAGKDSPLEKTKATVVLSNTRIQHQRAVRDVELARLRLASTWGGNDPEFERAAGQLDSPSPVPPFEELVALLMLNPEIARGALQADRKKAALDLEKAIAIPDITISGGVKRLNEFEDNVVVFGVEVPLPLFDRNQAGIRRAEYELAGINAEYEEIHSRIRIELADAYTELASAYMEAVELQQNVLEGAETVFVGSRKSYDQGKVDYLKLLDAQRTMFEAKVHYIDVLASYHSARADVERLIGRSINAEERSNREDE